jgi:hemolysin activation/secretion protein
VSAPFRQLDIESESQIFKIAIRHPLYRTLTDEVAISLIGEHLQNQNFIRGTGFSFTPGTTSNGTSKISALRFAQEWIHREPVQVLAFRSRFSVGLDLLDATNNRVGKDDPDAHFFPGWARHNGFGELTRSALSFSAALPSKLPMTVYFPLSSLPSAAGLA